MPKNQPAAVAAASDPASSRRRFLMKTLGLGAAGLALGGGAAWAKDQADQAATAGEMLAALRSQLGEASAAHNTLQLSYTVLQSEAARWQDQLTAATNQNAQLATALSDSQATVSGLQTQVSDLQAALESAATRLQHTGELVGLYEQLDAAGLDGLVANGLSAFAGVLTGVAGPAAFLRTGVDSARGLLSGFELTLPDFAAAMAWLGDQVVKLKVGLWSVENTAQAVAAGAVTGLVASFGTFTLYVLDHLPFNIGGKVRSTLTATQTVLTGVTGMTDAAVDNVLLKISPHVDDGDRDWKRTLVTPLREGALASADQVLTALSAVETSYQAALETPAAAALETRRSVRDRIAAHRAAYGV